MANYRRVSVYHHHIKKAAFAIFVYRNAGALYSVSHFRISQRVLLKVASRLSRSAAVKFSLPHVSLLVTSFLRLFSAADAVLSGAEKEHRFAAPEGRHPPSCLRLLASGSSVSLFDFFGDDFHSGGEGFVVLRIVHADAFVFVGPVLFEAREEIVAGDNQDTPFLEPVKRR